MKKLIKIIGIAIGAIIVIAIIGEIAGGDSQPAPTVSDNGTVSQPVPKPVKNTKAPVAELSATQLRKEYIANEVAADKAYNGKWIKVSGKVESITKELLDNEPSILLNAGGYIPEEMPQVRVYFDDTNQLSDVKKGQKITVIGKCEGIYNTVYIRIVDASLE